MQRPVTLVEGTTLLLKSWLQILAVIGDRRLARVANEQPLRWICLQGLVLMELPMLAKLRALRLGMVVVLVVLMVFVMMLLM